MFTPAELERMPKKLEQLYADLEYRIMKDVIERIKRNEIVTRAADWEIYRLYAIGESKKTINTMIKETLNFGESELNELYAETLEKGYAREEELYKATGKQIIPYKDNKPLQQMIAAIKEQTLGEFKNITQSLGFAVIANGKTSFTELADFYQRTLDGAMIDLTSGAFDYNSVIKRVVQEMTNSGLRTVDYASGWNNRVYVAVRRSIMTGIGQITGKISEDNAEKLGLTLFECTWHGGARPEHQVWQGRCYTMDELKSVCGYGTVTGLKGANCRHDFFPILDESDRLYTDEEVDEMNRKDNIPKEFEGKKYTAYEATQRQRKLETLMRKQRLDIKLLQDGEADENEVIAARCRYRATMDRYVRFSEAMDIPQQRARITADGLGNVGVGKIKKEALSSGTKTPIVNKITQKNIDAVNIVKPEGVSDVVASKLQTAHKQLLKISMDDNNSFEVGMLFDESMNLIDTVLGSAAEIDLNVAGRTKAKYVLHNHPNNASFSNKDINWLLKNRHTKFFTIVKNNGNVEVIYLPDNFDYKIFEIEYGRLIKKHKKAIEIDMEKGYNKVINDLLSKTKSGLIYER